MLYAQPLNILGLRIRRTVSPSASVAFDVDGSPIPGRATALAGGSSTGSATHVSLKGLLYPIVRTRDKQHCQYSSSNRDCDDPVEVLHGVAPVFVSSVVSPQTARRRLPPLLPWWSGTGTCR